MNAFWGKKGGGGAWIIISVEIDFSSLHGDNFTIHWKELRIYPWLSCWYGLMITIICITANDTSRRLTKTTLYFFLLICLLPRYPRLTYMKGNIFSINTTRLKQIMDELKVIKWLAPQIYWFMIFIYVIYAYYHKTINYAYMTQQLKTSSLEQFKAAKQQ